jgi:hypothetical protein
MILAAARTCLVSHAAMDDAQPLTGDFDVQPSGYTFRRVPISWQYVYSTPMACAATAADEVTREAIEQDFCDGAVPFMSGDGIALEVGITIASARK